jgi:8-oxo-dGTP pyrophosphatase MutT (NUDIX family)
MMFRGATSFHPLSWGVITAAAGITSKFTTTLLRFHPAAQTGNCILPPVNFLTSRTLLRIGHAVAALLVLEDGRYIMQLRDDVPDIWYPGHWGLFGGGVDTGEDDIAALRRELWEELELDLGEARPFVVLNYDLQPIGLNCYFRRYFEVAVSTAAWKREGSDVRALPGEEALSLPWLSPYDAFALFLHHNRARLAGSIYAPPSST